MTRLSSGFQAHEILFVSFGILILYYVGSGTLSDLGGSGRLLAAQPSSESRTRGMAESTDSGVPGAIPRRNHNGLYRG